MESIYNALFGVIYTPLYICNAAHIYRSVLLPRAAEAGGRRRGTRRCRGAVTLLSPVSLQLEGGGAGSRHWAPLRTSACPRVCPVSPDLGCTTGLCCTPKCGEVRQGQSTIPILIPILIPIPIPILIPILIPIPIPILILIPILIPILILIPTLIPPGCPPRPHSHGASAWPRGRPAGRRGGRRRCG